MDIEHNVEKIIIENIELLNYDKVLFFFRDKINVLKVSNNYNGKNQIDYNIINNFLENIESQPNIYGILTKFPNETNWKLHYIGQRKSKDIKQRLYQHLIKKHQNTGAQLDKVNIELMKEKEIGIKLMSILPDELRHYYEERLLKDIDSLDWNIQK